MAIIAICRGTKSYGTEMAECLAERLEYPVLGEEVLRDAASRLGVSTEDLEDLLTGRPKLWEPFSAMRRTYLLAVKAALASRVTDGNLVYHGLTGGLLLGDLPATLKLRCIAPMGMRVRAVIAQSAAEMGWAEAERYVRDIDEARSRWVKAIHDTEICDPELYDLVINLSHLTVDAGCTMIDEMVQQPEYEITEEVRGRLEDYRIACQVALRLHQDERLRGLELHADVVGGEVTVTGTAPARSSGKVGDRIAEAAQEIEGVKDVNLRVEWFDPYP